MFYVMSACGCTIRSQFPAGVVISFVFIARFHQLYRLETQEVKRPNRELGQSLLSSTNAKNTWTGTSVPPQSDYLIDFIRIILISDAKYLSVRLLPIYCFCIFPPKTSNACSQIRDTVFSLFFICLSSLISPPPHPPRHFPSLFHPQSPILFLCAFSFHRSL